MSRHEEIERIAHEIWVTEGCQSRRSVDNYYRAEAIWESNQTRRSHPIEIPAKEAVTFKPPRRGAAAKSSSSLGSAAE